MTDDHSTPPQSAGPVPTKSRNTLIWISISLATIVIVAGLSFLFHRSGVLDATASPDHVAVAVDDQYLVFLSQIEVERGTANGGKWDVRDGGPDLRYDIYWRGSRVFRSSAQKNTLLARWDQEELGIEDLIKGISPERSLKAARITAQRGETLEFRVVDTDLVADDEIGRWEVPVESLRTGDQTWNRPAPGILQAVCRVLRAGQTGR